MTRDSSIFINLLRYCHCIGELQPPVPDFCVSDILAELSHTKASDTQKHLEDIIDRPVASIAIRGPIESSGMMLSLSGDSLGNLAASRAFTLFRARCHNRKRAIDQHHDTSSDSMEQPDNLSQGLAGLSHYPAIKLG